MKKVCLQILGLSLLTSILALGVFAKPKTTALPKEKISVEMLLEKHLQSIGSPAAVRNYKTIMSAGTSKAVFKGRGTGISEGIVVLASDGPKNMIGMKFNNPDYQFEKMGYDGENFRVGFVRAGKRSVLGGFLRLNQKTFKKGLMGGTLSASWELLNYDENEGKLKYSGSKKIDGKKLYKFNYNIKKGTDLDVTLFFDSETFRHVRSEYKRVIASSLGRATGNAPGVASARIDNSARQSETRYKMVEMFDDFRPEGALTLPHKYDLSLEIETGNGGTIDNWSMVLSQFVLNQKIDPAGFKVDAY